MTNRTESDQLAGPGGMILSAAIFGFFGFFYVNWNTLGINGQVVFFRVLCGWTLKISAVIFVLSAVLTAIRPVQGNLLYSLSGLLGAIVLIVVVVLDVIDKQHAIMAYGPVILTLFAVWSGYSSWSGLKGVFMLRRVQVSGTTGLPMDDY